jgi:S1-C subfamily serine protease
MPSNAAAFRRRREQGSETLFIRRALTALALLFCVLPAAGWSQGGETAELYADWRDRIVQIQVIDQQAGSKAGIGSGFVAGKRGQVVTNYHVIADLLNEPERYQARFLAEQGQNGELELLAVDVVHDLALLAAPALRPPPLDLATELPPKGSRVWSMGYPFDIGLTIVEGTYNGMLEKSLYEKLHFTGSINPGMSGGPALNKHGEIVGVNVATAGNQVSFLVPVTHVQRLLSRAGEPAETAELQGDVSRQLLANQRRVAQELMAGEAPPTQLDEFSVPGGGVPWLNCWGQSEDDGEDELATVWYRCETEDDIFLSEKLFTGIIQFQHELLSGESLNPMRFYQQLENRGYYPQLSLDGDERSVTNYQCRSDFVDQEGLPLKVTWCVRRYRRVEGLYDAYLEITSLVAPRKALQSSLQLAGFDWENLARLSAHFLASIQWEAPDGD